MIFQLLLLQSVQLGVSLRSCLHVKRACDDDAQCAHALIDVRTSCGPMSSECRAVDLNSCHNSFQHVSTFLELHILNGGTHSKDCWCYEPLGSIAECEVFRQLMFHHPCLGRLRDIDHESAIVENRIVDGRAPNQREDSLLDRERDERLHEEMIEAERQKLEQQIAQRRREQELEKDRLAAERQKVEDEKRRLAETMKQEELQRQILLQEQEELNRLRKMEINRQNLEDQKRKYEEEQRRQEQERQEQALRLIEEKMKQEKEEQENARQALIEEQRRLLRLLKHKEAENRRLIEIEKINAERRRTTVSIRTTRDLKEHTDQHPSRSRTTRNPMFYEVRHWRQQLSEDLHDHFVLGHAINCTFALRSICEKHEACRSLWQLFTAACKVDENNECIMQDEDTCWQSYEGISWTGLGNCTCQEVDNSDCHWIRLHTTFNKCVYMLEKEKHPTSDSGGRGGQTQMTRGYGSVGLSNDRVQATTRSPWYDRTSRPPWPDMILSTVRPTPYTWRYTYSRTMPPTTTMRTTTTTTQKPTPYTWRYTFPRTMPPTTTMRTTTTTTQRTTTTTTPIPTTTQRTTTTTTPIPTTTQRTTTTTTQNEEMIRNRTISPYYHPWQKAPAAGDVVEAWQASIEQERRPIVESTTAPPATTMTTTTTTTRQSVMVDYSPYNVKLPPASESTCQTAFNQCNTDRLCSAQLDQLRVKCSDSACASVDECANTVRYFARYVSASIVKDIMFCKCRSEDIACMEMQQLVYPSCLYRARARGPITCTDAVRECQADSTGCSPYLNRYLGSCRAQYDECSLELYDRSGDSTNDCLLAMIDVRGTALEQQCYCSSSDRECKHYQQMMLPTNPCVGYLLSRYDARRGMINRSDNRPDVPSRYSGTDRISWSQAYPPTVSMIVFDEETGKTSHGNEQPPARPPIDAHYPDRNQPYPDHRTQEERTRDPYSRVQPDGRDPSSYDPYNRQSTPPQYPDRIPNEYSRYPDTHPDTTYPHRTSYPDIGQHRPARPDPRLPHQHPYDTAALPPYLTNRPDEPTIDDDRSMKGARSEGRVVEKDTGKIIQNGVGRNGELLPPPGPSPQYTIVDSGKPGSLSPYEPIEIVTQAPVSRTETTSPRQMTDSEMPDAIHGQPYRISQSSTVTELADLERMENTEQTPYIMTKYPPTENPLSRRPDYTIHHGQQMTYDIDTSLYPTTDSTTRQEYTYGAPRISTLKPTTRRTTTTQPTTTRTTTTTTTITTTTTTRTTTTTTPPSRQYYKPGDPPQVFHYNKHQAGSETCTTKNMIGKRIAFRAGDVYRSYTGYDGACSQWCHCFKNETAVCHDMQCLDVQYCKGPEALIPFNHMIYLPSRGPCTCFTGGELICERGLGQDEIAYGPTGDIIVNVGFSKNETQFIRRHIPIGEQREAGYERDDSSVSHDIKDQLQIYFMRGPNGNRDCKLELAYHGEQNIVFRVLAKNGTQANDYQGGEKAGICLQGMMDLENQFNIHEPVRYQVLMSAVKQLTVLNRLESRTTGAGHLVRSSMLAMLIAVVINLIGIDR